MKTTNNINSTIKANDRDRYKQSRFRKEYYFTQHDLIVPSPLMPVLQQNKIYLLENSQTKLLDSKYHYRPDLFCYDAYGDIGYYFILLFVNDMFSFIDFKTDTIKIPESGRMSSVLSLFEPDVIFYNVPQAVTM